MTFQRPHSAYPISNGHINARFVMVKLHQLIADFCDTPEKPNKEQYTFKTLLYNSYVEETKWFLTIAIPAKNGPKCCI